MNDSIDFSPAWFGQRDERDHRDHGRGIESEALQIAASRGLSEAAQDYDPDDGVDFVTHALPRVRAAVEVAFRTADGRIDRATTRAAAPIVHHPAPEYQPSIPDLSDTATVSGLLRAAPVVPDAPDASPT